MKRVIPIITFVLLGLALISLIIKGNVTNSRNPAVTISIVVFLVASSLAWLLMLGHAIFGRPVRHRLPRILMLLLIPPLGILVHLGDGLMLGEFKSVK